MWAKIRWQKPEDHKSEYVKNEMPSKAKKMTQADIDWENRTLCSDESCIGVIGPDGRCKECGIPYDGELKGTSVLADDVVDSPDTMDSSETHVGVFNDEESLSQKEDDWANRTLCSDESCIGVIGPDGRCKECGKPFSKASNE
jgi:hypothetical protein